MSDDLERRVRDLEARVVALAGTTAEGMKAVAQAASEATVGTVAALLGVVEELIALGVLDRNSLILVLERRAEHAEDANRTPVHRLALDGLLGGLRALGEPPKRP